MIKICHVTSVHKSTDIRIFEKECTSLAKKTEYEVFLVAKGESFKKNNVSIIGMGTPPATRLKRMRTFSKKVIDTALKTEADIYHLHDPELLQFVPYLKRNQKIVIFDSHEDVADSILDKDYIPRFARKMIAFLYRAYSDKMMRRCDALISVTPHIVNKLKNVNNNVELITNYPLIDISSERLKENNATKKELDSSVMVFAGGITPQWSHEIIIASLEDIEGIKYNMYGPASDGYIEKLKQLNGWKKTNYFGRVSFSEVQNALQNADIAIALLQPSHNTCGMYGTIGNTKLFESMHAGLPVICTNFDLWKEIIDDNQCGICVAPNSKKELENAIRYLINNPTVARKMGDNGKRLVNEKYNWNTEEGNLFILYQSLQQSLSKEI